MSTICTRQDFAAVPQSSAQQQSSSFIPITAAYKAIGNTQCSRRKKSQKQPFECTSCPQVFKYKQSLQRHQTKVHNETAVLKQPPTEKRVVKREDKRIRQPTAEELVCKRCPSRFKTRHRLTWHMRRCHPVKLEQDAAEEQERIRQELVLEVARQTKANAEKMKLKRDRISTVLRKIVEGN